jgi:diguanylate cyclase (GGDEF)-like protein
VVHEGAADVVVLRTLEPWTVVGELASTDGLARSATVRARSACRILKIPAPDFRNLLRRRPDILEELYWLQLERVRSLTRQVTKTHHRAITDPLTHLYNFGFFRERLEIELDRARHTGDLISLDLFDIDHFKHYNDAHGHQEGNIVLVTVAEIIKNTGRRGDIVARYGGEEFVALLYGASREEAAKFAEVVRQAVEVHEFPGGASQPSGRVTLSAGVATFPWDAKADEGLIKAADENLYRAKEGGRNRVVTSASEAAARG